MIASFYKEIVFDYFLSHDQVSYYRSNDKTPLCLEKKEEGSEIPMKVQ